MPNYVAITYKESGPVITRDTTVTDRLLIIGPALDGPSNYPVQMTSSEQLERVFGPLIYKNGHKNPQTNLEDNTYSFNDLVRAASEASLGGARDIWLCRVGGTKASATGSSGIGGATGLSFYASNAGRAYNGVTIQMTSSGTGSSATGSLTITAPASYGGVTVFTYSGTTTLAQLKSIVNSNGTQNRSVNVQLGASANPYQTAVNLSGTATLAGGTSGTVAPGEDNATNKYAMYNELTRTNGTFDSVVDFEKDLVLLEGIYLDDQVATGGSATTTSVVNDFGVFCYQSGKQYPTHGFIGLRPLGFDTTECEKASNFILANWEDTAAGFVSSALGWLKAGYFRSTGYNYTDPDTKDVIDVMRYVSVYGGPDVRLALSPIGAYQTDGTALYAGLVSNLSSEVAATKQVLPGTAGLAYAIREKQIRRLVDGIGSDPTSNTLGKGAIVIAKLNGRTLLPEIGYDTTFANDRTSSYADLQPQRVVFEAVKLVKAALEPFLGKGFTTQNQMAMEAKIRNILQGMVDQGKLHQAGEAAGAFEFTISTEPLNLANNTLNVQMTLWPAFQIKRISISATVKRS